MPWNSLSQSTTMLQNIYNDTSQILFRIISRTNAADQPYIITTQLNSYINIPIAIKQNSYLQYTMPKNLAIGPYIYIGFLPASMVKITMAQGFSANGVQISFQNCDGQYLNYLGMSNAELKFCFKKAIHIHISHFLPIQIQQVAVVIQCLVV